MVDGNIVIDADNGTSQAADPRLEMPTNSRSPQTQNSEIQEISEDIHQTHKIYHFQNCGTVYMDSLNARGVIMENCGNNIPQVICLFVFPSLLFSSDLAIPYYSDHRPGIIGNERVLHSQPHAVTNGMLTLAPSVITQEAFWMRSSVRSTKFDGPSDGSDQNRQEQPL